MRLDCDRLRALDAVVREGAFDRAARLELGWGMNPKPLVAAAIAEGTLVERVRGRPLDTPLYRHHARHAAGALEPLTAAVVAAARGTLLR
jgi:LysR family transcriptional regulator (chromosome initiation inhibitor)